MKLKTNCQAVVVSLVAILIFATACTRKQSVQTGSSHLGPPVVLPKRVVNAEAEPAVEKEEAVIVSMPVAQEFYVGGLPFPKDEVGEKVSRLLEGEVEPNRIVYIAASHFLDYGEVTNVIDSLRKVGVLRIALLVEQSTGNNGPGILRVQIPPQPDDNEDLSKLKPNPFTLVVSIARDLKLKLNQEPMGEAADPSTLEQTLTHLFQERKEQRAYKPGMETRTDVPEDERVEKTIVVKAQRSTRYGDVVRLIDAVKGTGGSPIVLQIDDLSD